MPLIGILFVSFIIIVAVILICKMTKKNKYTAPSVGNPLPPPNDVQDPYAPQEPQN